MGSDSKIAVLDKVLLYDGVCVFCNASVDFVLRHERTDETSFLPLQSAKAKSLLKQHGYDEGYLDSILYLHDGRLYAKSDAALLIAKVLKKPYSVLSVFTFIPRFIRDFFYDIIARNRYTWFGKHDSCIVPNPEVRQRFLE